MTMLSMNDLILVWGSQRRIITGSDLLGRLLRGIADLGSRKCRIAIGSTTVTWVLP